VGRLHAVLVSMFPHKSLSRGPCCIFTLLTSLATFWCPWQVRAHEATPVSAVPSHLTPVWASAGQVLVLTAALASHVSGQAAFSTLHPAFPRGVTVVKDAGGVPEALHNGTKSLLSEAMPCPPRTCCDRSSRLSPLWRWLANFAPSPWCLPLFSRLCTLALAGPLVETADAPVGAGAGSGSSKGKRSSKREGG
jgi:hypothetical protein